MQMRDCDQAQLQACLLADAGNLALSVTTYLDNIYAMAARICQHNPKIAAAKPMATTMKRGHWVVPQQICCQRCHSCHIKAYNDLILAIAPTVAGASKMLLC